jgi:cytochrome c oxidase cbb3-type subunit 3
VSLSGHKAPADWVAAGKDRFATICAGCHGVDAKGNPAVGAPNLTDSVWLHGGDFDTVRATIMNGRESQMPAHETTLGDSKVRLLAAYVLSLSAGGDRERTAATSTIARPPGGGSAPHAGAH